MTIAKKYRKLINKEKDSNAKNYFVNLAKNEAKINFGDRVDMLKFGDGSYLKINTKDKASIFKL